MVQTRRVGFVGLIDRVNGRLYPVLGPAMLGPYDAQGRPRASRCPLCGRDMGAHAIERSGGDTFLHCPVQQVHPAEATPRLSMLDMPMLRARRAAARRR